MKWGKTVMKSRTSLLNPAVLLNDFKSFAWIGVVYLLGLLFTIPFNLYLQYNNAIKYGNPYPNYLNILSFDGSSSPFIILIPVLTGLLLFRYLQTSKAADMVHALPIKRATLYNTHLLSGLIFLFVPLLITGLITWLIVTGLPFEHLCGHDVLVWLGISLIMNLLLFMTTIATGMITGMSSVQGILSYILLFLPTGLSILLLYNMQIYTFGFAIDYYTTKINISPLLRMMESSQYPIQSSQIIAYLLISILLYGLGRYLYQRRQLEQAGNALTFDILYPIFKYGVTFCTMLLLGAYLYSETNSQAWTYFAYLLGSLLAYLLMEILFKKSLHVFNLPTFKGYGIFALTMIILIAALQFDCTGYEKKVPALAEIESVYLDNCFYPLTYRTEQTSYNYQYDNNGRPYPPAKPIYQDQANIRSIHDLQQHIIANCDQEQARLANNPQAPSEPVSLAYTLKNGDHIYRQYALTPGKYDNQLKSVFESSEYKKFHNEILRVNPADVNLIEIRAEQADTGVKFSDPEQIQQAIRLLQQEVLQQSYAEMKDQRNPWANIMLHTNDHHTVYLSWEKSYADFDQWLKTNGQYNQARIIPDRDLDYAIVVKNMKDPKDADTVRAQPIHPGPQQLSEWEDIAGSIKITNPRQLEQCLQKYLNNEQQDYRILFVLKNGNAFFGSLAEADLPESVQ